mmetsp:Transcript_22192/g.63314  ORF Transcript_22192/g.63314 Transcript_22192/m.63314 type:complete len:188 (+) Transcript_22192:115-678(+)
MPTKGGGTHDIHTNTPIMPSIHPFIRPETNTNNNKQTCCHSTSVNPSISQSIHPCMHHLSVSHPSPLASHSLSRLPYNISTLTPIHPPSAVALPLTLSPPSPCLLIPTGCRLLLLAVAAATVAGYGWPGVIRAVAASWRPGLAVAGRHCWAAWRAWRWAVQPGGACHRGAAVRRGSRQEASKPDGAA